MKKIILSKLMLAVGVGLIGWCVIPSQAMANVCPTVHSITQADLHMLAGTGDHIVGRTIYFCKDTSFNAGSLSYNAVPNDLIAGGSQAIGQGGINASAVLGTSSINLAGFTPANISNNLAAAMPNTNGIYNSPSLYNFYIRTAATSNCSAEYRTIRDFLQNNAAIFQAISSGVQLGVADNSTASSIARINNALMVNTAGQTMASTISFFWANNRPGQFFTSGLQRFCWVGVGARIDIINNNVNNTGDYRVTVGVLTQ